MPRRFDVRYNLDIRKAHLLVKNSTGIVTPSLLSVDFANLNLENGFIDKKERLTQAGFLQVNALIAQAIRTKFRIPETTPVVPVSVIGDNGKALQRTAEGHLDDTTSKDGQATIRPWPSSRITGAITNLTVGVLTMNTHFSREAWKSPLRFFDFCSSEKGYGAHKVAHADVLDSVRTASAQLDHLATQFDTVAIHYYVNGKPSYGTGHASNSGATAILEREYENLMIPATNAMPPAVPAEKDKAPATTDVINLSHMLPARGTPTTQDVAIVAANTHPQANLEGFNLGDMEAASGHASCCAPSLYSRATVCCDATAAPTTSQLGGYGATDTGKPKP